MKLISYIDIKKESLYLKDKTEVILMFMLMCVRVVIVFMQSEYLPNLLLLVISLKKV